MLCHDIKSVLLTKKNTEKSLKNFFEDCVCPDNNNLVKTKMSLTSLKRLIAKTIRETVYTLTGSY